MEACEEFLKMALLLWMISIYTWVQEIMEVTRLLGQFLSFFDGIKKRKN
jgi:hypothetical protein